jgi:alpha-beta hydrolase superfamily lysophospholipase
MPASDQSATFFQQFEQLLADIPLIDKPTHSDSSLIQQYLAFYDLDLLKEGLASSHRIYHSEIAGFRIVEQIWEPTTSNAKTLVVCHGYFDHTALYGQAIRWALKNNFRCHCFDLPGHGLSSGKAGAIDSFDQYSEVLSAIIKREAYTGLHLFGQSTGCAIILNAILDRQLAFTQQAEKLILLAPLVRSKYWHYLRPVYFVLRAALSSVKRKFKASSHDTRFNEFLEQHDPLQSRNIPLCWLGAMDEWSNKLCKLKQAENIPTLIIQGKDDQTVDWSFNIKQISRCLPSLSIQYIDKAKHQLVNESQTYWRQVEQALTQFVND